jgi:hypothetical protein
MNRIIVKGIRRAPKMKISDVITRILTSLSLKFHNIRRKLGGEEGTCWVMTHRSFINLNNFGKLSMPKKGR